MSHQTIPKLNKRLIYWCLMGVVALSIPALISLASSKEKRDKNAQDQHHPQANFNSQDSAIISGMERFPENYGGVKEFEQELALANPPEEKLENALASLENSRDRQAPAGHYYHGDQDNPWHDANKREHKQRANDHYDARRSDIMFIDNSRAKNRHHQEFSRRRSHPKNARALISDGRKSSKPIIKRYERYVFHEKRPPERHYQGILRFRQTRRR